MKLQSGDYMELTSGIIEIDLHGLRAEEAVRKADEAMYSAKKSGKNQFAIK